MSDIIRVENLGKKYIIGHQTENGRYVALRDVLMRNAKNLWNKTKDLVSGKPIIQGDTTEEVWALKDVNFEIKRGEAVGVIGRNGAGKSTLLKILSRITEPTTGRVTLKGRIASLLEVGTGFHPELTGRENIYLNGTILGMTRAEIKRKFDEIVAFAEIEKYLDTPVKRYSSGMYVRLAFSVASHLEPEILLVDEVLAVGDAAFQKKCLGKMEEIGKEERTVLFVSHNMSAINALCTSSMLLGNGQMINFGNVEQIISQYIQESASNTGRKIWMNGIGDDTIKRREAAVLNSAHEIQTNFAMDEDIVVEMQYDVYKDCDGARIGFRLTSAEGCIVLTSEDTDQANISAKRKKGSYRTRATIPRNFLNEGTYSLTFGCHIPFVKIICFEENCITFNVEHVNGVGGYVDDKRRGIIRPLLAWNVDRA